MKPALLSTIDGQTSELLKDLMSQQESYLAKNDCYFQGIATPAALPEDGAEKVPNTNLKPTDQEESWASFELPAQLPVRLALHVYDGPHGKGYVISEELSIDGDIWRKDTNVGPETWRNTDWTLIPSLL